MNKIKTVLLVSMVFVLSAVLVGCGCQKKTTYTVTFDSNGGTKVAKQEVNENEKVEEPEEPTREGYTFKGWYLDGKKYDFDKKVTKDIKLKAKWSKVTEENNDNEQQGGNNNTYVPVVNNNTNSSNTSKPSKPEVVVKKDAEVSVTFPSSSTVGLATELTLTTKANDYAGKNVVGVIDIDNPDVIEKIEYLDENDNWVELAGDVVEASVLADVTETYRITFNQAGEYTLGFFIVDIDTDEILAQASTTITIDPKPIVEAETIAEFPEKIYVGEETEFSVTTKANSYAGLMVVGTGSISDETAVESFKYLEVNDNNWYDLPFGSDFGPATGFPLSDATSKFKVKFSKAGTYDITFQMVSVEDQIVVSETTTTITVELKEAETIAEFPEKIYVGEETEFSVTTKANSYAGLMVVGTGSISDETAVESFKYLEVNDNNWYDLPFGSDFGPASGFPLSDATSKFKVTFSKAGTYDITFQMVSVEDQTVVSEVTETITVTEKVASEVTFDIPEQISVNIPTEFTVSTSANDYAGLMVVGTGSISNPDAIEKLEYLEVRDNNWYELPADGVFGSAEGFPLSDATSTFRVTFNQAGSYDVTFQMVSVEDQTVVSETATTIVVE